MERYVLPDKWFQGSYSRYQMKPLIYKKTEIPQHSIPMSSVKEITDFFISDYIR